MKNKKLNWMFFTFVLIAIVFAGCEEDPVKITPKGDGGDFQTNASLDKMWSTVQKNATGLESRDICEFLVEAAGNNWPQDRLRTALKNIAALQIRDKSNQYYGNFLWAKGNAVPSSTSSGFDINGVLFCGTPLTLLRLKYYNKLDAENQAMLEEIIQPVLVCLQTSKNIDSRRAAYTNTWAMRMWVLCGLGEALGDNTTLNAGKESLREWMSNIRQYGIVEYNSGVYGPVAARALGCLAKLIEEADIKREANIGLKYFSRLYFGNFVSYDDRGLVLGGAQSRNYNFVHSKGGSDLFYRMMTGTSQNFFESHAAWNLSADDRALYNKHPRTIVYKNGTTDTHFAVHYVGSKVSMGSAGRSYAAEDKTYVINFFDVARPSVVHISSVTDGRSDPYGENPVASGNTSKPRHLSDYLMARAQRVISNGSEMVFLIATDGSERTDTKILNHYTILPADRQDGLWNGNTPVGDLAANASQTLSTSDKSTFFVRFANAVAGIRYLKVLDVNGADALSQVKLVNVANKAQSISAGTAMYLQAPLSTNTPAKGKCGVVAVWWKVKENVTDEQFTAFRNEMINAPFSFNQSGDEYTVKVTAPDGELGVSGNKATKLQTAGYGGLTLPKGSIFTVDGADITPALFSGSTYAN